MYEWIWISDKGLEPHRFAGEGGTAFPDPVKVEICREWLRANAEPTRQISTRGPSSYGWKHNVERGGEALNGRHVHVSNGAFLVAALLEGYRVTRCERWCINGYVGLRVRAGAPWPGHLRGSRKAP